MFQAKRDISLAICVVNPEEAGCLGLGRNTTASLMEGQGNV
jgi:hypothetical protein